MKATSKAFLLMVAPLIAAQGCGGREYRLADAGVADGGWWQPLETRISEGWVIESSANVADAPEQVSTAAYRAEAWRPAKVPGTVFGSLADSGIFGDELFFGMNLRSVPGMDYTIGSIFSDLDMPDGSPYAVPWFYRTDFSLPEAPGGRRYWLEFTGINYKAGIYLNGSQLAAPERTGGIFRHYEFNVTGMVRENAKNGLALLVQAETPQDLGITFVDWNLMPPDKDMGIWDDVILKVTGDVAVANPYVQTVSISGDFQTAVLRPVAELKNGSQADVAGTLIWRLENAEIRKKVTIKAGETIEASLEPGEHPELTVNAPRLWWPIHMGKQELYTAKVSFEIDEQISDTATITYGIRKFGSKFVTPTTRVFTVNGRRILIRGAGYTPDMMLRRSDERDIAEIQYTKHMNLNAIRLEGKLGNDHLLKQCDEQGILVIAGWCCCDRWERWYAWDASDRKKAVESLKSQIRDHRGHASVIAWFNGSDKSPPPDVEAAYLEVLKEAGWPLEQTVSSADDVSTALTGPTGVKMTGPYDWVPPNYWLLDKTTGGAFGFNTETGPGPAVPPLESLVKMLPPDHRWPVDEVWNFHAGGGAFKDISKYSKALDERYGTASGIADFAAKSQLMAYESIRAMYEAYGRNKYASTGVIHWMLNNAWPSLIWHLYDYYLKPAGGYFGARKANEPLHIQYSYDSNSIAVVNSHPEPVRGLKAQARVFNIDLTEKFNATVTVSVEADSVATAMTLPSIPDLSKTYFLRLALAAASGKTVSENLYWLSTSPDEPDFSRTEWYYTPVNAYADLKALAALPVTTIESSAVMTSYSALVHEIEITLKNRSDRLAFFVRAEVASEADGLEILPARYDENYVSLWPGETTAFKVHYSGMNLPLKKPFLRTSGMNVAEGTFYVSR
jgi:exo-1,4-beta-D-glucosaminidase